MKKITAAEKRHSAIAALCDDTRYYYAPVRETVWTKFHSDRADVAASIRALASLGRTARWTEAVEAWAVMVEESTEETFRWAFDQYGIWAAYAAE